MAVVMRSGVKIAKINGADLHSVGSTARNYLRWGPTKVSLRMFSGGRLLSCTTTECSVCGEYVKQLKQINSMC